MAASRPRTVPAVLDRAAQKYGDRVWVRTDDREVSFEAAGRYVAAAQQDLQRVGIRSGDLVALTARNEIPYLLCILAVTATGGIAVPLNPAATRNELEGLLGQLVRSGRLRAVVTDQRLRGATQRALPAHERDVELLDVNELVGSTSGSRTRIDTSGVADSDVAMLIATSGTTGSSKLVMQTHRAYVMAGEGFPYWLGLTGHDRLMTALPLFHTNALAYSTMGSLEAGAGLVLLPRFSASGFLDAARRHAATSFNAVGAMLEMLMRQPKRSNDADNPLRVCYVAPSPTRDRHLAIEQRFGIEIVCGYGLSESIYGLAWRHGTRPFGTLGWPRQHPTLGDINAARVVDEDGFDVSVGGVGELHLRNPTVTPGYLGMAQETQAALEDGWLHTGDLVRPNPDGTYSFVSRKKEVIRRRGENLSPREVEEVLSAHPHVVECAVVGVPSDLTDEDVKAYVVATPYSSVRANELRDWTAQNLAVHKVPRFWQFVEELPHTPTGRVVKNALSASATGPEIDLG